MSLRVTIRLAVPSDIKVLKALALKTVSRTCKNDYSTEQLAAWKNALSTSDRLLSSILHEYFIVAEVKDNIVGFGSIDQGTYLNYLYVHHEFLRSGIATRISKVLLQEAVRLRQKEVTTHASLTAVPFFERLGFNVLGKNTKMIDGISISNYLMNIVLE